MEGKKTYNQTESKCITTYEYQILNRFLWSSGRVIPKLVVYQEMVATFDVWISGFNR